MPIAWKDDKIAVRTWELIPKYYKNIDVLKSTVQRYKNQSYGIKKLQSGGNGRELLIDFDSLDKHIQEELGDPRKVTCWMDKFFSINDDANTFFSKYRFENGRGLDNKYIKEYTMNASTLIAAKMLRSAREHERLGRGGSLRGVPQTIWVDVMNYKKIQEMKYGYSHTLPNNERRFADSLKRFEAEGYISLISKKHNNTNALKVTADVIEVLNGLFAGTRLKPSPTSVARQYVKFLMKEIEVIDNETAEVLNPLKYPPLEERIITAYLNKWEHRISNHKVRAGDRQRYMNKYRITHRLDKPQRAGSIISVDDRNPPFVLPDGSRVWFYIGIDLASEAWTTYVYSKDKKGIINDFYRNMVRDYVSYGVGLPLEIECESALNSSLKNSVLQEDMLFRKVRIERNNSTGKKIEQYFRKIRYGLEKEEEGWQGRPFARNEANQPKTETPIHLEYKAIVELTIRRMQEWNNMEHPEVKGKTRWEVFLENQRDDLSYNWDGILSVMGKVTQTSCRVGYIELNGQEWCIGQEGELAVGEKLIATMKNVEGKKLTVRWLDDKEGNVIKAYAYIKDRYVCELVPVPRYNRAFFERTEQDFENQKLMKLYANTVTDFGRKQAQNIKKLTIIKRTATTEEEVTIAEELPWPTEEEQIVHRKKKSLLDRF